DRRRPADKTAAPQDQVQYLDDLIVVRIARMSEAIARLTAVNIEDRFGIRMTDMRILSLLRDADQMSVGEISRLARVDKAWISRLSRELEDKGLVARVPDPQDSRAMLVSLTRKGRELQSKMLPQSIACDRFLLQGLDRQKLVALLTKLDQNLLVLLENSGAVPDQDS
ncbi:MAG: MarR family winged helix-turn-helix transcriptional regulator, partial [Bradyrhizobium sp.]|nr:MarR family winged helix-turn-helix transcriptional regulator [Bradyrhizobium sp.]